ncbi:MAG: hypothetical protein IPG01_01825 [Chitinophagaceae bacterium]|nr:hypothetical protein [Chitinophagaceae bacterium]
MSTLQKIGNILLMLLGIVLVLGGIVSAKIDSPRFQSYLGDKVVSYLSKSCELKLNWEM